MNNLEFRVPKNEDEFNEYDLFRWRLLRKPIGKTIESLKDEYEDKSFHLIGVIDNQIVACGRLHFIDDSKAQIRYMAVDEVPVNEFVDDTLGTDGVVRCNVVHSLIRENNSPAKGVVGFVALVDLHFMCRILELEADPQI